MTHSLPAVLWILVDGLSCNLLARFAAAYPESTLGALVSRGRMRPLAPLRPNCQTPPSLFSIWSGKDVDEHKLTGYDVPVEIEGDPAAYVDAFSSWPKNIPMIWDRYAQAECTVRLCSIPFVQPERLGRYLLSSSATYGLPIVQPTLVSLDETFSSAELGLEFTLTGTDSTLFLMHRTGNVTAVPIGASVDLPLSEVNAAGPHHYYLAVKVTAMVIEGQVKLMLHGYSSVDVNGFALSTMYEQQRDRSFVSMNPAKLYQANLLGRRLRDGGKGEAESILADLMKPLHDSFTGEITRAVEANDAQLVIGYYPVIDLLSHQILANEFSTSFDGSVGSQHLFSVLLEFDRWLSGLLPRVADNTRVVIHSDHGMTPLKWDVYPNRFLLAAGWLVLRPDDSLDTDRSVAFFHPAENGLLVVHVQRAQQYGFAIDIEMAALNEQLAQFGLSKVSILQAAPAAISDQWDTRHYLQPPDEGRLRFGHPETLVSKSHKGGDHTVYHSAPWLRGVLVDASQTAFTNSSVDELTLPSILETVLHTEDREA
ncbi:alkaline phosphatase family protein [Pseudomonas chlororaphis]|nr:alkaline phosphatase family protein [Pseudomonas chlororaphis]